MDRAATFSRVMRRLGEFDVVAYDRRGYAGSRTSGPSAPDRSAQAVSDATAAPSDVHDPLCGHARDLLTVVEWVSEQDPDLPRLVVGHSLGALIALVAAATPCGPASGDGDIPDPATVLPRRLRADALCLFEPPLPWLDPGYATSGSRAIDIGRSEGPAAAAEFFYRAAIGDRAWSRLDESDQALRRSEGETLMAELAAARAERAELPLPAQRDTVHVGRGDRGPVHLRAAAEVLAEAAGVDCHVIAGASHGAHLQHPDRFAQWVRTAASDAIGAEGRR